MVQLGWKVRDKLTGFTGIVTGRCEYISGCNQALVNPPVDGGKYVDGHWFDEQRLVRIGTTRLVLDNGTTPGFGEPAPVR